MYHITQRWENLEWYSVAMHELLAADAHRTVRPKVVVDVRLEDVVRVALLAVFVVVVATCELRSAHEHRARTRGDEKRTERAQSKTEGRWESRTRTGE